MGAFISTSWIPDFVGLIGVGITLVAYMLLQMSWMRVEGWGYSILNAVGSLLILFSLYFNWNSPSVVIETCWVAISIYGCVKSLSKSKESIDLPVK